MFQYGSWVESKLGIADTAMYGRRLWYCRMYVHLWLLCTSLRKVVLPGARNHMNK